MGTSRTTKIVAVSGGIAALSTALVLVPWGPGDQEAAAATLTPFSDCDELRQWFAAAAMTTVGPYGFDGGTGGAAENAVVGAERAVASGGDEAAAPTEAQAAGGLDDGAVSPGATGTNVQEVGVDEPDLLKTDGDRVVAVWGDRLHVLDATGSTPRVQGSVRLPDGLAGELLLFENWALVLGTTWSMEPAEDPAVDRLGGDPLMSPDVAAPMILPAGSPAASVTVVDLSDPTEPEVVRTDEVDGSYVSAREHDGAVRVVVQSSPWLPWATPMHPGAEAAAALENQRLVADAGLDVWLPDHRVRDSSGRIVETSPGVDCTAVSHPGEPSGTGLITVLTLDLADPDAPITDRVAVAADGDLVYASTERLYVATTSGGWVRPMPIDLAASDRPAAVTTQLHAFDISSDTTTSYVASGEVEGWLLGRWAMSEHDDLLRVAATRGEGGWFGGTGVPDTDAAVTVLRETDDRLVAVGSVGGLGKGEQVRAVRWFGDVATVVTFRQTDPLYTVDLSDPTDPRVLGELKIPGYSAYLHPLGDGLVLGVGQDATEDGRLLGTQVSTFDLRDLADPTRVDTAFVADSWSDVEGDSRAFAYLPERRLAVLPLAGPTGSGLWALQVGSDGSIDDAGRWTGDRYGWLARAIPVGDGDRLAVLHESEIGGRVTIVSTDGLRELGTTKLR